eukprot:366371-Chlamydomonas_euryale.AAC.15
MQRCGGVGREPVWSVSGCEGAAAGRVRRRRGVGVWGGTERGVSGCVGGAAGRVKKTATSGCEEGARVGVSVAV